MTEGPNFQRRAGQEGRLAQDMAALLLESTGFHIVERNHRLLDVGVTVNFVCRGAGPHEWYFDVSGAVASERPGLERTDTMWKTLGRANVLSGRGLRYLVILTSNMPKSGSIGDTAMRCARSTFFDAMEMTAPDAQVRLRHYATTESPVSPLPGFWSPEESYRDRLQPGGPAGADFSIPLDDPVEVGTPTEWEVEGMDHQFRAYLPSETQYGQQIDKAVRAAAGARIKAVLSEVGGGCTSQSGIGSWLDPTAGVVNEEVVQIETYSTELVTEEQLRRVVEIILDDLDQHTAAVVIDQRMFRYSRSAT